jgi:hypothetical protein
MNQAPDPDDNSAALRASAEEDIVRAVLERVLSSGEATDKFSGWVLAAAGGFIALQFGVASAVAPRAPIPMLTAILITVVSLFVGAMVRLMVYNTDLARVMEGIDTRGGEIRDQYETTMIDQARYLQSQGKPVPPLRPLDFERINRNVTALVNLEQRWLPHMLFEGTDTIIGLMIPKPVAATAVDGEFEGLDRPVRLATAAQFWAVVQLLVLIVAVAVGAVAYGVAALHSPGSAGVTARGEIPQQTPQGGSPPMSNDEKPRDAIPSSAFPLPPTKTQEQRAREGDPPPKQTPAEKPAL